MKIMLAAGSILAMTASIMPAMAQEPAVSELNIQLSTQGGVSDDEGVANVAVKGTFPVAHSFGVQLEGGIGNQDYYGVAGHFFWRDPEVALAGLLVSQETLDGVDLFRAGGEAELYLGAFTISARAGYQEAAGDAGVFGSAVLSWYAMDNLALRLGGEATNDVAFGRVAFEWQPVPDGWHEFSVFGSAEYGGEDRFAVLGGFRVHLGEDGVTLKDRERREDPTFAIFNFVPLDEAVERVQAAQAAAAASAPPPELICERRKKGGKKGGKRGGKKGGKKFGKIGGKKGGKFKKGIMGAGLAFPPGAGISGISGVFDDVGMDPCLFSKGGGKRKRPILE